MSKSGWAAAALWADGLMGRTNEWEQQHLPALADQTVERRCAVRRLCWSAGAWRPSVAFGRHGEREGAQGAGALTDGLGQLALRKRAARRGVSLEDGVGARLAGDVLGGTSSGTVNGAAQLRGPVAVVHAELVAVGRTQRASGGVVDLGGGHGAGALRLEMEKGPTREKK
jgi:hypothetical protein